MKILGMKVLLPAVVDYDTDDGIEKTIFCHFDPATGEVHMADYNCENLKNLIRQYIISKKVAPIIPPTPSRGFEKLNPENYTVNS